MSHLGEHVGHRRDEEDERELGEAEEDGDGEDFCDCEVDEEQDHENKDDGVSYGVVEEHSALGVHQVGKAVQARKPLLCPDKCTSSLNSN